MVVEDEPSELSCTCSKIKTYNISISHDYFHSYTALHYYYSSFHFLMLFSGDASSLLSLCVPRCCHERQTEAHLQTPEQLSRPPPTDVTTEPRQLVSEGNRAGNMHLQFIGCGLIIIDHY